MSNLGGLTFLAPVAGAIALAVSAPLLLLLYFLKLRRRPLRVSSTILWESATADLQVNAPFRWIRFSWLLLLQLLLLLCLVGAVARPALDTGEAPGGTIVILIDASASMSAADGANPEARTPAPTRLEEAKEKAGELVRRLGGESRAMVVAFGARAQIVQGLTRDRGLLRRAIDSIEATDEPGDLGAAARLAMSATAGDDAGAPAGAPGGTRAVLFSDGSFGALGRAGGAGGAGGAGEVSFGRATLEFVRVGPGPEAGKDNIGIVALAAKRDFEDPATVRVFARLLNAGPKDTEVSVACRLSERTVGARTLLVPRKTEEGPGEAPCVFEFQSAGAGVVTVALARRDLLGADDGAAVVLRAPGAPRLWLVQPNVPSEVVDFLPADALETLSPRELRTMTAAQYEALVSAPGGASAPGSAPTVLPDLIVFDRVRPSALPPAPSISFGATVPIAGVGVQAAAPPAPESGAAGFTFWQRTHPLMRYVNLNNVVIMRPMRVNLPEDGEGAASGGAVRSTVLASGPGGPLIALVERAGVRRVIVGFELAQSRWWQDPSFPVFLKNAVEFLTLSGDESAGRSVRTGEAVSVRPAPGATEIRVTGPREYTKPVGATEGERVSLGAFSRVGVYRAEGAAEEERAIAVNLADTTESAAATSDTVETGAGPVSARPVGLTAPREIWPWLVLAALVLLSVEWMMFAWRMRV